jgi:hypothetical protein
MVLLNTLFVIEASTTHIKKRRSACPAPAADMVPMKGPLFARAAPRGDIMGEQAQIMCRTVWNALQGDMATKRGSQIALCAQQGNISLLKGSSVARNVFDLAAYKTNNAEHTGCVDNEDLLGESVVEMLFKNYTAYYVSFTVGILFMGFSAAMHYLRRSYIHIHSSTGDDLGAAAALASALQISTTWPQLWERDNADDRDLLRTTPAGYHDAHFPSLACVSHWVCGGLFIMLDGEESLRQLCVSRGL